MKIITTAISGGVLGPLFFAYIGLQVDLSAVLAVPLFVLLLTLAAFFGKLVGAGVPALWIGFQRPDALMVGVGMTSRGAIQLVVLGIVLELTAVVVKLVVPGLVVVVGFTEVIVKVVVPGLAVVAAAGNG